MKILGIETSCDETAVAVISATSKKIEVLSNVVSSQIKLHAKWGGVVPNLASREHAKNINLVLETALKERGLRLKDIDLITVTSGPGLIASLIIGTIFARALSWKKNIPIIGVNHIEGHIFSNWLGNIPSDKKLFPSLCLIVSGGHTELVLMQNHGKYKMIGQTLDDAAGEAFDKIARILGLGYPGGPIISAYAEKGNPGVFDLPRPMIKSKNYDFSFSGLKTAVLYLVKDLTAGNKKLSLQQKRDIAASAQEAIVDVLIDKTVRAAKQYPIKSIMLSGGVSANQLLRERLVAEGENQKIKVIIPELKYTTDNGAMIAVAGYYKMISAKSSRINKKTALDWRHVIPDPNWEIV